MAALKEDRSYGLSCGRVSDGSKVSVFHVKLTDSALRAFESYRASQVVPKHVAFGESHEGSLEGSDLPPFENAAPQVAGDGGVLSPPSTAWLRVALAKENSKARRCVTGMTKCVICRAPLSPGEWLV
ncbi:ELL [Cervus elaphus hippelaphus]|uniref:ELL n=1 Tax=Cervus elaphus hippelaphus TaxID=46360 RepID=A0A212D1X3_CEREH|nr:ELL [Cervus elaphus hippelaphus]